MSDKPYVVVEFPADKSGCFWYRMLTPKLAVQSVIKNINFSESSRFILDQNWFKGVNLIHMQRQVSTPQKEYFTKFLYPLSLQTGSWLIYNIDDAIYRHDIPKYNSAWSAYQSDELMDNIKEMLKKTDFLVTTTEYIKNYYHRKFNVPLQKILVIPNYLPRWWIGQYYDLNKVSRNFDKYRKRPRIGIISSSTHYDLKNKNNGVDDFTDIIPFIRKTVKKYEWVFMNSVPNQLIPELKAGKITRVSGDNIMNYPEALSKMECQAFVQPLIDCEFNRCKSPIKFLEAAAMGTPLVAQRIGVYDNLTDLLFDDTDELEKTLNSVLSDKKKFLKIVKAQKRELDSGRNGKGWWLENNINDWTRFYRLTSKCIDIDVEKAMKAIEKPKSVDGLEIVR